MKAYQSADFFVESSEETCSDLNDDDENFLKYLTENTSFIDIPKKYKTQSAEISLEEPIPVDPLSDFKSR